MNNWTRLIISTSVPVVRRSGRLPVANDDKPDASTGGGIGAITSNHHGSLVDGMDRTEPGSILIPGAVINPAFCAS